MGELVKPHQSYNPQQKLLVTSLECVQKFGLCMCYKHWDLSYNDLLDWAQIPALKTRRTVAKLILFAQMVNKSVHTTSSLPETRIMDSRLCNYDPDLLYLPISKTKHFMSSFSTMLWNSLPPEVRNSQTLKPLKTILMLYFTNLPYFTSFWVNPLY